MKFSLLSLGFAGLVLSSDPSYTYTNTPFKVNQFRMETNNPSYPPQGFMDFRTTPTYQYVGNLPDNNILQSNGNRKDYSNIINHNYNVQSKQASNFQTTSTVQHMNQLPNVQLKNLDNIGNSQSRIQIGYINNPSQQVPVFQTTSNAQSIGNSQSKVQSQQVPIYQTISNAQNTGNSQSRVQIGNISIPQQVPAFQTTSTPQNTGNSQSRVQIRNISAPSQQVPVFQTTSAPQNTVNSQSRVQIRNISAPSQQVPVFQTTSSISTTNKIPNLTLIDSQGTDVQFQKIVANFYGCKLWKEGKCAECSQSYFFNKNGVCCEVQTTCKQFNKLMGICQKCYDGYKIINGKCQVVDLTDPAVQGCQQFNNGLCIKCCNRHYLDGRGGCAKVDGNCQNWNKDNGNCFTCYKGYTLINNLCTIDPSRNIPTDLLCKTWVQDKCTQCSQRAYFDNQGKCQEVQKNCNTWSKNDGSCLTCYKGYDLINTKCLPRAIDNRPPRDIGCGLWDWDKQVCLECSFHWKYCLDGICCPLADDCQQFDENANCLQCWKGYDLKNGSCVISTTLNGPPKDLGCAQWDWDRQVCLKCSNRFFKNNQGICRPSDDFCQNFNDNGICLSCFKGYDLVNGGCQFSAINNALPKDIGCAQWDWFKQVCLKCSQRWIFDSRGVCRPLDENCRQFNEQGQCITCYKGFDLLPNGTCTVSLVNINLPKDIGCAEWNWDAQVCLKCSQRWQFNSRGVCIPLDDNCMQFGRNGECIKCYKGFKIGANGTCSLDQVNRNPPKDIGCAVWDWDNQRCLQCSLRWQFNSNGVCTPLDVNCKTFNQQNTCIQCYKGFDLTNGNCVVSKVNIQRPKDIGCAEWDWDKQVCLKCSLRWKFNQFGVCTPLDDNCKQFNTDGTCRTCYKGFALRRDGTCAIVEDNRIPKDLGCAVWDWDNQKCLQCSQRFAFNSNGVCTPLDNNCSKFNNAGQCIQCYKGYDLNNGICRLSSTNQLPPKDIGCKTWDWDRQVCLQCSFRFVMRPSGQCVPVSNDCQEWNSNGVCLKCYVGFSLNNGNCQKSNILCKTVDANGNCSSCFNGYVLYKFNCMPIEKLASMAEYCAACKGEKI